MTGRWVAVIGAFLAVCVVVAGLVIVWQSRKPQLAPGAGGSARASESVSMPTSSWLPADSGCVIGSRSERLVEVGPEVARRVNAAWDRIERWLAVQAPATVATLGGPSTVAAVASLQEGIGVSLPADLVASLLRHGEAGHAFRPKFTLPPSYKPLWTREIQEYWEAMCGSLAARGASAVGSWWHGKFVPIATGPPGWLFYDQRQGTARLGRQDPRVGASFEGVPASLTEFLEQTADVLEGTRSELNNFRPTVTPDGALGWNPVR